MSSEVKTLLRKLNRVLETRNNILMRGYESSLQSGNPPLDLQRQADKKPKAKRRIQKENARFKKLDRQAKSLKDKLKEAEKKAAKEQKKESNRVSNTAKQSAQRAKSVEQKKKSATKTKLKNLSLRGRGGGGSMKMPQEYTKRSLLKKPLS